MRGSHVSHASGPSAAHSFPICSRAPPLRASGAAPIEWLTRYVDVREHRETVARKSRASASRLSASCVAGPLAEMRAHFPEFGEESVRRAFSSDTRRPTSRRCRSCCRSCARPFARDGRATATSARRTRSALREASADRNTRSRACRFVRKLSISSSEVARRSRAARASLLDGSYSEGSARRRSKRARVWRRRVRYAA